jgi:hypothetical protein
VFVIEPYPGGTLKKKAVSRKFAVRIMEVLWNREGVMNDRHTSESCFLLESDRAIVRFHNI